MQEKWPPTVRKFRVFVAAISDSDPVCLCLGWAGRFSKCAGVVRNSTCLLRLFPNLVCAAIAQLCENSAFLSRLFPAYVCDATGVVRKFHVFVAAISGLCVCVPVYVCICVCLCMCRDATQSCENSMFSLRLFPAYVSVCCRSCENSTFSLRLFPVCICVCLDPSGPASRCGPEVFAGISESELCCNTWHSVATTQLLYPHLWELGHAIQSNGPLPQVSLRLISLWS